MSVSFPILLVAVIGTLMSVRLGIEAAQSGHKLRGIVLAAVTALACSTLLGMGLNGAWPENVGWFVFLAGVAETLLTKEALPTFEIIPVVTDDPSAASWPTLFCLQCKIETKAKRTFAPDPPPVCPRCGKPLQG